MNVDNNDKKYIPKHTSDCASLNNSTEVKENTKKDISSEDIQKKVPKEKLEPVKEKIVVKKKKRYLKRWVWTTFLIIFLLIIAFSLFKIFFWAKDNNDTKSVIDDISNNTKVEETKDDENTELINEPENKDETNDYWYYIKQPLINVDINALKEKNKDTVGWINVNNTNINYPYVQGKDNKYYLNHSYDKSYNEAGWVFLDYRNNSTLSDKNNILYAHSRLDKTMFGSLSKTLKSNWYNNKDNHIIRLSTEIENTMWQIFSVYKIPEETYYITTNFSNDSEYEKFLNIIKERSIHNFNTDININDKVLTLSTCYSDTERTVVHAKLIKRSSR